jgi:predicted nucleic acid-binding Zn ribbon protein
MRRLAPRPLAGALGKVTAGLAPATTLAGVQAVWTDVAGAMVASEAEPVSEREGTVTIACRSSVWAQELELLSPDLLEKLRAALGGPAGAPPLRGLRFVVGGPRRPPRR